MAREDRGAYSYLSASTGLAIAARLACNAIVIHATASAATALAIKSQYHVENGAAYANLCSH